MPLERTASRAELSSCTKAGRWKPALSLLSEMLAAGFTPDAKGYSELISVCGKAKQWRHAVAVIDGMEGAGVQPNEFHFSGAISACARCGQADVALRLFDSMGAKGVRPNAVVYNAAISACGGGGRSDRALSLLSEMRAGGAAPTVVSFSSAMSACGRDGRWESALGLLSEMRAAGIAPDAISYNAAISACATASNTSGRDAVSLLDEMREAGLKPTVVSFGAAIGACERGVRWERALSLLDEMRREGVPPDMSCFREAMQVLVAAVQLDAAFALLRRVQEDASFSHESRYVIHHTLLSACRREGDGRAARLQATMRALGLSAPSAAVVARFTLDGEEETQLSNGAEAAGSAAGGEALNAAVDELYERVRAQTAYRPRFDALPLDFVQRASEAEQVRSLKLHAEKKALTSLLLHGAESLRMRIEYKVCADCHAFLTHAAALLGRPVHVLEPTRQHLFGDRPRVCSPCESAGGDGAAIMGAAAAAPAPAPVTGASVDVVAPEQDAEPGQLAPAKSNSAAHDAGRADGAVGGGGAGGAGGADDAVFSEGTDDAERILGSTSVAEAWIMPRARGVRLGHACPGDETRHHETMRDPQRTRPPACAATAALTIEEPGQLGASTLPSPVTSTGDGVSPLLHNADVPLALTGQGRRAQRRLARERNEAELLRACMEGDRHEAGDKKLPRVGVQFVLAFASVLVASVLGWCCDLLIARGAE